MSGTELHEQLLTDYDQAYVSGEIDFLEYERARNILFPLEDEEV